MTSKEVIEQVERDFQTARFEMRDGARVQILGEKAYEKLVLMYANQRMPEHMKHAEEMKVLFEQESF